MRLRQPPPPPGGIFFAGRTSTADVFQAKRQHEQNTSYVVHSFSVRDRRIITGLAAAAASLSFPADGPSASGSTLSAILQSVPEPAQVPPPPLSLSVVPGSSGSVTWYTAMVE